MNPLDDNELQEILTDKLNGLEPQDTDHLWAGIERSLPVQTGGGMIINFVKLAVGVGALTAILISDRDAIAEKHDFDFVQTEIDHPVEVSAVMHVTPTKDLQPTTSEQPPIPTFSSNFDTDELVKEESDQSSSLSDVSETTPSEDLVKFQAYDGSLNGVHPTFNSDPQHSISMKPIPTEQRIRKSGNWYWSGSTYLTFHSMEPSRLDENYINSDPNSSPSVAERIGANASVGYAQPISQRLTLLSSIGLDYYRTTFNFRVINDINPSVALQNDRIDLGLNVGLSYRHRGFTNNESIEASIGYRTALVQFHKGANTYSNQLLTYRLGYLVNHRSWQFGPYYSSFINSRDYVGYGKITPTIYGVMVRKNLFGN